MKTINGVVEFFMELVRVEAVLRRRLDSSLGGISFQEFIILRHLSEATEQKMRRIDLAGKVGLTASGITRLLLPMEKIGLVKRLPNKGDARVSLVALAKGGQTYLDESMKRLEELSEEYFTSAEQKKLGELGEQLGVWEKKLR